MNNENAVCSIHNLPYEVLCKIFDILDIWSVKHCSRTCKRWKETIFSDFYIKRFKVTLDISALSSEGIHTLEQSDRLYCNMIIKRMHGSWIKSSPYRLFNGIYSALSYPKLEQLVTLKITFQITTNGSLRMMLTDAIARMKVLRELYIDNHQPELSYYGFKKDCIRSTWKIRSNSIELLDLRCAKPSIINAPKLSSLRISYHLHRTTRPLNLYRSTFNVQHSISQFPFICQLPNLKSLDIDKGTPCSLSNISSILNVLRFFEHHESLQTLNLKNVKMNGYLFKAICKNCTNLTKLSIESLNIMKTSTLQQLSNLAKLRHLQITNINCLEPASFDFVKLPNLESVGIGSFPMRYETLDAFKSATKITILSTNTTTDFMRAIAIKMPKLKQIELTYFSQSVIESLNLFKNIEVRTVAFNIGRP